MANPEAAQPGLRDRARGIWEGKNAVGKTLLLAEAYMIHVVISRLVSAESLEAAIGTAVTGILYLADKKFGRRNTTHEAPQQQDQQLRESQVSQIVSPQVQELSR